MSIARLVFPNLHWAEFWEILSFLSIHEVYILGCTCRSGFVTFLREKELRKGIYRTMKCPPRFLGRHFDHDKVLLVSYPRCGNSYVRKLLEASLGVVTGSDSRPNRPLSASLLRYGYIGEGISDQSVWVVKSHFPERMGFIRFPVKKVILVVRNPFDAIESYFHMGMTNTHDKSLTKEAFSDLHHIWKDFVVNEADIWAKFYDHWIKMSSSLPILIVRYEDILQNEIFWLRKIIDFLSATKVPHLHRWQPSWDNYQTLHPSSDLSSTSSTGVFEGEPGYQPKKKVVGKALYHALTVNQAEQIHERTLSLLQLFGYELAKHEIYSEELLRTGEEMASTAYMLRVNSLDFDMTPFQVPVPHSSQPKSLIVNDPLNLRAEDDNFGRKITDLRRKYTANDTKPFDINK